MKTELKNIKMYDLNNIIFYDADNFEHFQIIQDEEFNVTFVELNFNLQPIRKIKIEGEWLYKWLDGKIKRSEISHSVKEE